MQITTKKLFYYTNILIYLFLWVFWILLCIFCKKEGLWECYVCITHDEILKTYFLRWHCSIVLEDMFYWNISWHWILTTRGHLWYDDENIQWKSSWYKHETYIKNEISLFHKRRLGLSSTCQILKAAQLNQLQLMLEAC